jgi:hypothetical protein
LPWPEIPWIRSEFAELLGRIADSRQNTAIFTVKSKIFAQKFLGQGIRHRETQDLDRPGTSKSLV